MDGGGPYLRDASVWRVSTTKAWRVPLNTLPASAGRKEQPVRLEGAFPGREVKKRLFLLRGSGASWRGFKKKDNIGFLASSSQFGGRGDTWLLLKGLRLSWEMSGYTNEGSSLTISD